MKKIHVVGTVFFIISFLSIIVFIKLNTHGEDVFLGSMDINAETEGWNLLCNGKRKGVIQIPAKLEGDKGESVSISKQISFFNREEQYLCFRSTQNKWRHQLLKFGLSVIIPHLNGFLKILCEIIQNCLLAQK